MKSLDDSMMHLKTTTNFPDAYTFLKPSDSPSPSQSKEATKTSQDDDSESVMPCVDVEGIPLPTFFDTNRPLTEHVHLLKSLEMREDDVVLLAYSKAGTHWMWEIASMLVSGKAQYEKRTKGRDMLEAAPIESIQDRPSPRVLNSHLPFRLLPRQILEKKVKVIHVYRNVKDVFVSMYFHFRQYSGAEGSTFDGFEKVFFSERVPGGEYIPFMKQMDDCVKKNPDLPVFTTSFEDMKEDPENAVKNLAEFLGVKASPQLCKDIAEATSFAKLKKANEHKQHNYFPQIIIHRKGDVGDWKNYMTVAQSERFDAAMTQLASCDFRFRYTL